MLSEEQKGLGARLAGGRMDLSEPVEASCWFAPLQPAPRFLRLALAGAASHLDHLQSMFSHAEPGFWCGPFPGYADASSQGVLIDAGSVELALRCSKALRADSVFGSWVLLVVADTEDLPRLDGALEVDDFVLRPLDLEEVQARLRAARRRQRDTSPMPGTPFIDPTAREVRWGDRVVALTARELALIQCLRQHDGSVISRAELLAGAWGPRYRGSARTVDTHISRLRSKLAGLLRIDAIRALGYRPIFSNCQRESFLTES